MPRSCAPRYCSTRFWWRVLLSCRLARLDLNTIQLSISSKIEFCEGFTGRISSFWTFPGRFRRIVAISKSGVGDVWMRKTPGVALWGEKPRRKYYGSLHFTRWTAHFEANTYFVLALYGTPSRQQCYSSRNVNEGDLGGIPVASWPPVWTGQRKQSSILSNMKGTSRLLRPSRTSECPRSLYCMLLASYTIGRCVDLKGRPEKGDEVNSAKNSRTLARGPATTHIGFRSPEGELEVRRLITSALVDSCSVYIVETCVLIERWYVFDWIEIFWQVWPRYCYLSIL